MPCECRPHTHVCCTLHAFHATHMIVLQNVELQNAELQNDENTKRRITKRRLQNIESYKR